MAANARKTRAPRHPASPRRGYGRKGQAVIELALSLPILILLIFFTFNAYHMLHTSHVGQRYASMNVYMRIQNRTQFVKDEVSGNQINRGFTAVQYTESDGRAPIRKIVRNNGEIINIVGICRETGC